MHAHKAGRSLLVFRSLVSLQHFTPKHCLPPNSLGHPLISLATPTGCLAGSTCFLWSMMLKCCRAHALLPLLPLLSAFNNKLYANASQIYILPQACVLSSFSPVRLVVTHELQSTRLLCPWGFSKQEYWGGLPCPPPGDLSLLGIEPASLWASALVGGFFTTPTTCEDLRASL